MLRAFTSTNLANTRPTMTAVLVPLSWRSQTCTRLPLPSVAVFINVTHCSEVAAPYVDESLKVAPKGVYSNHSSAVGRFQSAHFEHIAAGQPAHITVWSFSEANDSAPGLAALFVLANYTHL